MTALRDGAESAASRAEVAQNHERGRAAGEALVHVRAARRFAHGMQAQPAQARLQIVYCGKISVACAQPNGEARSRILNLNQHAVRSAKGAARTTILQENDRAALRFARVPQKVF